MKTLQFCFMFVLAAFTQPLSLVSHLAKAFASLTAVTAYNLLKASPFGAAPIALGANTLSNLIPDTYIALDVVSRELTGFIQSVARDSNADRIALNQTARAFQTPANTAGRNITPSMSFPAVADQTIANKPITISKSRAFPFNWTGEEQKSVNAGPGYLSIRQDQIAQAIRAAVNEIETDLGLTAYAGASRAYGTAGTTPFGTNLGESAQMKKILDDNGAGSDRSLVVNTSAGAALRTLLNNPLNANTSLNTPLTQQGVLLDLNGYKFRESAQVASVTKGTGASYTSNTAGYAIGATAITLITGSGTVLAGDVVTFAGDSNKYVVAAGVAAPGVITLAAPGLRQAIPASATAMTIGNNFVANIGLARNAMILATRLPALPEEGDMAIMREVITDPRTGLSFELAVYGGYRMVLYEIGVAWGYSVIKPEHMAIMLG